MSFEKNQQAMNSPAGYFGAITAVSLSFLLVSTKSFFGLSLLLSLFLIVFSTFVIMAIAELYHQNKHSTLAGCFYQYNGTKKAVLKSAFWRFAALFGVFMIYYSVVHTIVTLSGLAWGGAAANKLQNFVTFLDFILIGYVVLGIPYIYFTLSTLGSSKYEYVDYAVLSLILFRSIFHIFSSDQSLSTRAKVFLSNRRMSKIFLVYLVSGFFSSLMCGFVVLNFNNFYDALNFSFSDKFTQIDSSKQLMVYFQVVYWLIFLVDTCIALVSYNVASRWLNNRTRSIDGTFWGWWVALGCYPPVNNLLFSILPSVNPEGFTLSDNVMAVLMFAITTMYLLYVWATIALGFRFGNLVNRGVVSSGPYRFIRHPAYFAKNIAWWFETPHLLAYPIVIVGLIFWNFVYFLRAITEERHLLKSDEYKGYCEKVKYRFIPRVF